MQYVCDAPGRKTWFRIETEGEAMQESEAMRHSLDYCFRHEREAAVKCYAPSRNLNYIERNIGLGAHVQRTMPIFLTLRDSEGTPLATAVLPQADDCEGREPRIVGPEYSDAFEAQRSAIAVLERHMRRTLRPESYKPLELSMG